MRFLMMVSTSGVGGVTSSVKNLESVLESQGHQVAYVSKKALLKRYDVVHVHFSRKWVVVAALMVGRLIARRTVMTVHNGRMDAKNDLAARLSLRLAHGVVFLNDTVEERNRAFVPRRRKVARLTSLLTDPKKLESRADRSPSADGRQRVLLYAYRKNYEGAEETYGILWVRDNLDKLPSDTVFTIVDPTGEYADDLKDVPQDRIRYIGERTDFVQQLRQHDVYLRPTATDGMSVAVLEALIEGVPVVASDVVPRPEGVLTYAYKDAAQCAEQLTAARLLEGSGVSLSSVNDYLTFVR